MLSLKEYREVGQGKGGADGAICFLKFTVLVNKMPHCQFRIKRTKKNCLISKIKELNNISQFLCLIFYTLWMIIINFFLNNSSINLYAVKDTCAIYSRYFEVI